MRFFILIIFLSGCATITDKTESLKKTQTIELKSASTDKGSNSYSGDPVDHIVVTASGNGSVNLTVGDKGKVSKGEKRDTSDKEELKDSFSVDYYLRSIPVMGWAFLGLVFIGIIIAIWVFLKTTMAGKALDGAISKGLELTEMGVNRVMEKLSEANKGTDLHTDLLNELARLRKQEAELKAQSRNGK